MQIIKRKISDSGRKRIYFCGIRIYKSRRPNIQNPKTEAKPAQVNGTPTNTTNVTANAHEQPTATIRDFGKNNRISIANPNNANLRISVWGDNNTIEIKTTAARFNTRIEIGSPNSTCNGATVIVEEKVTVNGMYMLLMENNSSIHIGPDCQFANDILVWCTDTHYITDMDGNLTNVGKSIEIGEHCWIGLGARILKNTRIPKNCIVGMSSVITRKFDTENAVYVGNPATLVKSNIKWGRLRPQQYMDNNNNPA